GNVNAIKALKDTAPVVYHKVLDAFALSLHDVFLSALPVVVVALIVALFIKEIPLKQRGGTPGADSGDSDPQVEATPAGVAG
ncbi:MAG: hypothetical protein ACRDPB_07575, partial [Nocardioidaceae bacterium]